MVFPYHGHATNIIFLSNICSVIDLKIYLLSHWHNLPFVLCNEFTIIHTILTQWQSIEPVHCVTGKNHHKMTSNFCLFEFQMFYFTRCMFPAFEAFQLKFVYLGGIFNIFFFFLFIKETIEIKISFNPFVEWLSMISFLLLPLKRTWITPKNSWLSHVTEMDAMLQWDHKHKLNDWFNSVFCAFSCSWRASRALKLSSVFLIKLKEICAFFYVNAINCNFFFFSRMFDR